MYLVGVDHPHKHDARTLLERLVAEKSRMVTSVEVLQEILHRFTAIRRKEAIQPTFDILYRFIDKVYSVEEQDLLSAKDLLMAYDHLSARDALHAAQMKRLKIETIFSFDAGFDCLPGLTRVPK